MTTFSAEGLRAAGFGGFVRVRATYLDRCSNVPSGPGVYAVIRSRATDPTFLQKSEAGHFKGKDPTVPIEVAQANWVDGTTVLYLGKADNLQRRLSQLLDFGNGRPVGHWGGRLLWQLAGIDDCTIAWRADPDPRAGESSLLAEFFDEFGALPYANLTR